MTAAASPADELNQRGNALRELNRHAEALATYETALALDSDHQAAMYNRATLLLLLNRSGDALAGFDRLLLLNPDDVGALTDRGNALQDLQQPEQALASYRRALAINPDYVPALYNCAHLLLTLQRLQEAVTVYDALLTVAPDLPEVLVNRGTALLELNRPVEAIDSYDRALAIKLDSTEAHYNRGNALQQMGRFKEAIASYGRAIELQADFADAYRNRGDAQLACNDASAALADYDRALALAAATAGTLVNRGNALLKLNRPEEALASYDRALALEPQSTLALRNRAHALLDLQRVTEALAAYDCALAQDPHCAVARYNRSLCLLVLGDLRSGWPEYEYRWQDEQFRPYKRHFAQPLWLGAASLQGKRVLLHAEQGLGDTIQFCRYTANVRALGATVLLEVQPTLVPLLSQWNGIMRVIGKGSSLPDFDYQCPLLSLPLALKTELDSIPADVPYVRSDAVRVARWQERLGRTAKPRIGIVWSGRMMDKSVHNLDNRSVPFREFAPILSIDADFISLQNELRATDVDAVKARGDIQYHGNEIRDFADTAALIELTDMVITVDTSVAHLAGAMGKSVWILLAFNADWRWLLDRDDNPWYPSARLFRQSRPGDWSDAITRVASDLSKFIAHDLQRRATL